MNTIRNLAILLAAVSAAYAQSPTQIDVSKIRGAAQIGADGKVLAGQLPAGGSGGSGASQTAQLQDWKFTRVSAAQLKFGESCVPASPCNVDIGGTVSQFSDGPYLINLSGANVSGTVCVYVSPTSQITVGLGTALTTAAVTGSSSLTFAAVNACPQDAAKLARWDVANGAFNSTGYSYASYLSYKPSAIAGTGIQILAGSRDTVQIDTGTVLRKFTCAGGPAAALPAGATQGDICWDFNAGTPNKYVCSNASGCSAAADWKQF